MKERRVLEITGEPIGTGGQEMFIVNILRHINRKGLRFDWLTPYFCENEKYKKEIIQQGGKLVCFNLPFKPGSNRFNLLIPLYRFLKVNKYDVVHIHSGSISVLAYCALVSRVCGVKNIIVHSHCAGMNKNLKYFLVKAFFFPFIYLMPTTYCACSLIAGEWKYPASIVKRKLIILKNGIDLSLFNPSKTFRNKIREKYQLSNSTVLIGHVGRFSYMKNHEYFIELVKRAKKKTLDIKVMLIGDGELYNSIVTLIRDNQLEDFFIFVGTTSKVYEYLQAMDVFLLPSRWEGLPIVGVEAQGAGLPVIASDRVSTELKLVDDVCFLPLDNIEKWLDKILEVSSLPRKNNIDKIREQGYDINQTAEEVRKLYITD